MYYHSAIEILKQVTFVGALLSGFSLTYLIGLFQLDNVSKVYNLCLIVISLATCFLLISTLAGSTGIFWLSERPVLANKTTSIDQTEYLIAYRWSISFLLLGMFSLLLTIGMSGFLKSKKLGLYLATISSVTALLTFYFLIFLMKID